MTVKRDIERRLGECLNRTELYGVQCRIEDAAGLTAAERKELAALLARRRVEVEKLHRDWRRRNGLPDEEE